jgi:hypothetical protein
MVLPDYPRHKDLAGRTTADRRVAGIHVVLLKQAGIAEAEWWTP